MKVFITGATGFVGGRVASALINRGDEVTLLVRSPEKSAKAFPRAKLVSGELGTLGAKANDYLAGIDGMIHCAAHVAPFGKYWADGRGKIPLLSAAHYRTSGRTCLGHQSPDRSH